MFLKNTNKMKNHHILILFFLLFGCKSNLQEWSTIEISCKIENENINSITFYAIETLAENSNNFQNISINGNGDFIIKYALYKPINAMIMIEDKRFVFFLEPNEDLAFRYENGQTIEFLKENKKNNTVFLEYQQQFSPFFSSKLNYNLESKHYTQQVDSISSEKFSFLELKKNKLSKDFITYLENDIKYYTAKEKIYFARRYSPNLIKEKNNYFNFLETMKIQDSQATNSLNYLYFIDNYINYLYLKKIWSKGADYKNDYIEKHYIAKSELSGEPLEQFLTENFILGLQSPLINEEFMVLLNEYISEDYTEISKNLLKKSLSDMEENKLAEGKVVPKFSLKDINNQLYSLSDFTKKYIILDFWASWCSPCRREIPEMKILSEKYKDIAQFIFISIDNDVNVWEKGCDQLNIPEPSLIIDSVSRINYGFDKNISVPFYLVVDNKGKIILSNTTKEKIVSLLKE